MNNQERVTEGECHRTFKSKLSLIKHLKVRHHIVIVGFKHGRPEQDGRLAYCIWQQLTKAVLRAEEKKLKKQIRKQISLWDPSDGLQKPEFAYEQHIEDVSHVYQCLITQLCLEDSYGLRVNISLSILEMRFERFPGVLEQNCAMDIVLEALTPLKFNQGNDKEQGSLCMNFGFTKAD
ncbi:uncharacterized protein EV154DRAFT_486576 [Mucor mucedo]|uniref:uncharacterized protein n=1 Tax=Mucor mucedo TaxID=29922 RepID=UPI002220976D|nr:uncharacterized protein EV154DRAFT_486576 [Mucor mucedo]KAI7875962.1 hypothetical protein EV154DRAFT_486576 [Mucor mucedo]